jgi:hypothetical protein
MDEALQERGRGDYEQTNARSRARWHGGLVFFLSRSCVSIYIGIELVQDFFLATPGLVGSGWWVVDGGQWVAVSCLGGWMGVGEDS